MARRGGASRFRFRVLPSVLLTAAILLLPALLYAWGRQADAFAVERVTVGGGRRIPDKQALKLLRNEFLGRNLFTVTTADVREVLERLCYLASVEVDRDFPTTLRVKLIEYRPAAYVLAKGRWFVVADGGHVVCEVPAGETPEAQLPADQPAESTAEPTPAATSDGVPADDAAEVGDLTPSATQSAATSPVGGDAGPADGVQDGESGSAVVASAAAALTKGPPTMKPTLPRMATGTVPRAGRAIEDEDVRLGLRVLVGLPASLRARVQVLYVGPEGRVSLDLADGPRVELGDEERLVAKVLALRAVLAAYRRGDASPTFIDVSAPDRPMARPRLTS
jgi:hypothetical protein